MKLAFISDIHSNMHALVEVLRNIEELSIDEIWCCGDIVGYNAFPQECLEIIKERHIPSVLGNHDWATLGGNTSWFNFYGMAGIEYSRGSIEESDMSFLQGLPNYRSFDRDGVSFYMTHGSPRDNIFEYVFPWSSDDMFKTFAAMGDDKVIVMGHTHIPMEKRMDDKIFLNPGSVGQPRDGDPQASFMIFDTSNKIYRWYRIAYDIDAAAIAIREKDLPSFLAERLYLGH